MRLLIALPAHNEAENILGVLRKIPKHFSNFSEVLVVVVDDGSIDGTAQKAALGGAEVIVQIPQKGLAATYNVILKTALEKKADFLVHLDADGQYEPAEIALLLEPLLKHEADMVIGDRQVKRLQFMSSQKRIGNLVGSFFVKFMMFFTGKKILRPADGFDASSGFRGLNERAIRTLLAAGGIHSHTTYTHESLMISAFAGLPVIFVPITFLGRAEGDSSRLIKSVSQHILKCFMAIFITWLAFMVRKRKIR